MGCGFQLCKLPRMASKGRTPEIGLWEGREREVVWLAALGVAGARSKHKAGLPAALVNDELHRSAGRFCTPLLVARGSGRLV